MMKAAFAAFVALTPMVAVAQAPAQRININLSWEGDASPQIALQTPSGATDYSRPQPILIDEPGQSGTERYFLIVRYPGVNQQFGVRARANEPPFPLRLRSPVGLLCDTGLVSGLLRDSASTDTYLLINATLSAGYLQAGGGCREGDKPRLARAMLAAQCGLARETNLFRLPDGAGAASGVAACRYQIAASQARTGRIAQMDETLGDMRAARAEPGGAEAFALARLTDDHLRRIEVDGLFNTALDLRDNGDGSGQAYAARLAELEQRPEYRATFQAAFRRGSSPALIVRDLERQLANMTSAANGP